MFEVGQRSRFCSLGGLAALVGWMCVLPLPAVAQATGNMSAAAPLSTVAHAEAASAPDRAAPEPARTANTKTTITRTYVSSHPSARNVTQGGTSQTITYHPAESGAPSTAAASRLVRSTVSVINQSAGRQDYRLLWYLLSPRLQAELDPETIAARFSDLSMRGIALDQALGSTPEFDLEPYLLEDGRLRLRGRFPVNPQSVRFDLIFVRHSGVWKLDAIAFAGAG